IEESDPSESVAVPISFKLSRGRVIALSTPALTTGAWLGAGLTTRVMLSVAEAPSLSVTVNWKVYVPVTRLDKRGVADEVSLIVYCAGPDTFFQLYFTILPSGSVPLPTNVILSLGSVIVLSDPALATGV